MDRARAKRLTWRVLAFAAALVIVVAVVLGAIYYSESGTYRLAVSGDRVSLYRGSETGLLGLGSEYMYDMPFTLSDMPEPFRTQARNGKEFSDAQAAREFEFNVQEAIDATSTTTTTTTTTSTTSTTTSTTTATTAPTTGPAGPSVPATVPTTAAAPPAVPANLRSQPGR